MNAPPSRRVTRIELCAILSWLDAEKCFVQTWLRQYQSLPLVHRYLNEQLVINSELRQEALAMLRIIPHAPTN